MTQTPSQDARDMAWAFRPACYPDNPETREKWNKGIYDGAAPSIKAFARFEAHIRSTSPVGEVGEIIEAVQAKLRELFPEWDGDQSDFIGETLVAAMLARLAASDTEAMLAAAYEAGATDTHNWWAAGNVEREPDFAEAALDYARAAIAKIGQALSALDKQ